LPPVSRKERRRVTDNASTNRRTVRQVTLVVETTGLSEAEHDRRVFWAESNILNANLKLDQSFVATVITSEGEEDTRLAAAGHPTDETRELIEELKSA
jgi:hypothetical protein